MITKEFVKIGKNVIRQVSGVVEKYIAVENEKYIEEMNVAAADSEQSIAADVLVNTETEEWPTKFSVKRHRLSKSQILQFISYHFLNVDDRGVVRNAVESDIAELVGCTIKTVRNNNIILDNLGLIYYSRSNVGINIQLIEYPHYFDVNGSGYIDLHIDRLKELATIENVNSLRLELRKELIYDNAEVKRIRKNDYSPSVISFNDFKMFTPKYTHYKAMMTKITEKGTSNFTTTVYNNNTIFFNLAEGKINGKSLKEKKANEYEDFIKELAYEKKCIDMFQKRDIEDLTQLAFEYSIDRLTSALKEFIYKEFELGILIDGPTRNIGGKVRTIIRQHMTKIEIPEELDFNPYSHFAS